MARPMKLTDEERAEIARRRRNNETAEALAKRFKVSKAMVYNIAKDPRWSPSKPAALKTEVVTENHGFDADKVLGDRKLRQAIEARTADVVNLVLPDTKSRVSGGAATFAVPSAIMNVLQQYEMKDAERVLLRCLLAIIDDTPKEVLSTCADQLIYVATFIKMRVGDK